MRQQYNHALLATTRVQRDEDWVAHRWYRFLLWMLGIGGAAILCWLFYGGFMMGRWTVPKPTTTTSASVVAPAILSLAPAAPSPARVVTPRPAAQPATPAAPQQVQISGSLDLVYHNQKTQTATPTATQPTPQNRDEAWAQHLERNP